MRTTELANPDIVIVGAGLAGLVTGRELSRRGHPNFLIAEAGSEIGGVWRDNRYPGAACDIPVDVYCLSDHLSPEFNSSVAKADELLAYIHEVAERSGLTDRIRLNTKIVGATWDETAKCWQLTTAAGERWNPRFLVWAGGRLHQPLIPQVPGAETFRGEIFHTARWRNDIDLTGRNVALVGAGATSIQVVPNVADRAKHLYAFMRNPPHCLPMHYIETVFGESGRKARRENPALLEESRRKVEEFLEQQSMTRFPMNEEATRQTEAIWKEHFESIVKDPHRREVLTPRYRYGCRRPSFSDRFYHSLSQPNVTVLGTGLAGYTTEGVVTTDGTQIEVDVVVLATGFHADQPLGDLRITGRNGVNLASQWDPSPEAYLGVVMKNFPNLFVIDGPNAELASATVAMETHAKYVGSCIELLDERASPSIEVRAEVQDAYNADIDAFLAKSTYILGGCRTWHRAQGGTGRLFSHWPGPPSSMRKRLAMVDVGDFIVA